MTKQRRAVLPVHKYERGKIARRCFVCSYLFELQSKINIFENSVISIVIMSADDFLGHIKSTDISLIENKHRLIRDSTIRQSNRSVVALMEF